MNSKPVRFRHDRRQLILSAAVLAFFAIAFLAAQAVIAT